MKSLLSTALMVGSAVGQFLPLQMSQQGSQLCNLAIVRVDVTAAAGVYLERFSITGSINPAHHVWFIRAGDLPPSGWDSDRWVSAVSAIITAQVPLVLWLQQGTYYVAFAEGAFLYEPVANPTTYANSVATATTVQVGSCPGAFGGVQPSLLPPFSQCGASATGNLGVMFEFADAATPRLLPTFGYITAGAHDRSGPCLQPHCAVNVRTVLNARIGQIAEFPFYLQSFWQDHVPFVALSLSTSVQSLELQPLLSFFEAGNYLRLTGDVQLLVGVPTPGANISAFLPIPNAPTLVGAQIFYQGIALPFGATALGLVGHLCVFQIRS